MNSLKMTPKIVREDCLEKPDPQALRDAYGSTLVKLGEKDRNVVVLDADLSSSTRTSMFAAKFPDRFFNMGLAEQNMMGTAAGLAKGGKIPFASTFAIFASGRAWEQIRQSIAYSRLNVKIVATHGGITVGEDGPSHQTAEDLAIMRVIPGMTLIVPADAVETGQAVEAAYRHQGPVFMRLTRGKFPTVFTEDYEFQIGKGTVVNEGEDLTIFACGLMVYHALQAAKILSEKGISARVVNLSTLKPLDRELIVESAKKTRAVVTAEEHSIIGGLGSAVTEVLSTAFPVPVEMIGVKDSFGTSGQAEELLKYFELEPGDLVRAGLRAVERKNSL